MGHFKYVCYIFLGLSIVLGITNVYNHSYFMLVLSVVSIIIWTLWLAATIKKERNEKALVENVEAEMRKLFSKIIKEDLKYD